MCHKILIIGLDVAGCSRLHPYLEGDESPYSVLLVEQGALGR
jgi:hypothetical protein